jgi:hypothetical protein
MEPDPKPHSSSRIDRGVPFLDGILEPDGAANRFHRTRELCDDAVADRAEDAPEMLPDVSFKQFPIGMKLRQCRFVRDIDEAGVADDVRSKNCGELAIHRAGRPASKAARHGVLRAAYTG